MRYKIAVSLSLGTVLAVVGGLCGYFLIAVEAADETIIPFCLFIGLALGALIGMTTHRVRQAAALGMGISGLAMVLLPLGTKASFSAMLPVRLLQVSGSARLAEAVEAVIDGPIGYIGGASLLLMGWVLWGLPDKATAQDSQQWSDRDDDPLMS